MKNQPPKHGKQVPGNPHPDTPYIIYEGEIEYLKTINDSLQTDELEMEALRIFDIVSDRRVDSANTMISNIRERLENYRKAPSSEVGGMDYVDWEDIVKVLSSVERKWTD